MYVEKITMEKRVTPNCGATEGSKMGFGNIPNSDSKIAEYIKICFKNGIN